MLDVSLIFKIAGVSILILVLDKILESCGRKEYAVISNLAGIVIVLMMVLNLVSKLFNSVKTLFQL